MLLAILLQIFGMQTNPSSANSYADLLIIDDLEAGGLNQADDDRPLRDQFVRTPPHSLDHRHLQLRTRRVAQAHGRPSGPQSRSTCSKSAGPTELRLDEGGCSHRNRHSLTLDS